jgi:GNAT superfamily N-acetyltransferase
MSTEKSNLEVRQMMEVRGPSDIMRMRKIRNACRPFMTGNNQKIGLWEQLRWWRDTYIPGRKAGTHYGFLLWVGDKAVGYGLITFRDYGIKGYWVSGGLLDEARGQGHGEFLFTHLSQTIYYTLDHAHAYLAVQRTNERAQKLYQKIGYQQIAHTDRTLVMEFPGVKE